MNLLHDKLTTNLGTTAFMAPEVLTSENQTAYTVQVDSKYLFITSNYLISIKRISN